MNESAHVAHDSFRDTPQRPVYMMDRSRKTGDPEFELVVCAARTSLEPAAQSRLESILEQDIEWPHVVFLARYHRVVELLYQTLRRAAPGAIRGEVENYLRNAAHRTVAYNMVLLRELGRLSDLLEAEGVPIISFKGPLLAHTAYGNLGLRSSVDLDFLIPPNALPRLTDILSEQGYAVQKSLADMSALQRRAYERLARQVTLVNPARGIGLDVHTDVLPPGYRYAFSFDELLQRSRRLTAGGVSVRTFAPEDMIHLLCFHGVKNRWDQLKFVCDVAEFVRSHPDLDWDEVLRRSESTRGERILLHGLHVGQRMLNAPIPDDVTSRFDRVPHLERLAEITVHNLLHSYEEPLGQRERREFHLKTQDGIVNKTRYVMYSIMRHVGGIIDI